MDFFVFSIVSFYEKISNKIFRNKKGSLTVEAALVLPVFICGILTIGFITKAVYAHEIIQHSIDEAANEMAAYSYIYYISGVADIDKTIEDGLEEKKGKSQEDIKKIVKSYKELNITIKDESIIQDIVNDHGNDVPNLALSMWETGISKGKTAVGNGIIRNHIKNHGLTDSRLKSLNIDKLDFSSSTYFENSEDIDVIVKYKLRIPLPIKIIDYIPVVQRATVRAWMAGDEYPRSIQGNDEDNKEKGKDRIVYVSEKGSRYHRFGCYSIFKEIEALDLQFAKNLRLKPCEKCNPPIESDFGYTVFKSKRSNDGRYHKRGCTHLFKDIIKIPLKEAEKKYNPCKICNP
ncbi:TadE/TadG family type IV pilus assembly protein [Maledivibacter halophilus]|uniref:TadE-like protein n=1 Tax=Maledivibacter halophilus TaxID=36842 RepID=A0A1T5IFD5_9FIRM|nr:TadE family protein [Maledivibacter halophilus]SKC37825.1 hypothetical protein SAMN02194393_00315 [Maledivibacter halophilus]